MQGTAQDEDEHEVEQAVAPPTQPRHSSLVLRFFAFLDAV
jgi:hypothetical protein